MEWIVGSQDCIIGEGGNNIWKHNDDPITCMSCTTSAAPIYAYHPISCTTHMWRVSTCSHMVCNNCVMHVCLFVSMSDVILSLLAMLQCDTTPCTESIATTST